MIAWAGQELHSLGISHGLDFTPRPRWPLTEGMACVSAS
jgi:tRNA A37 threonylcarbamoyltransferase TsaD